MVGGRNHGEITKIETLELEKEKKKKRHKSMISGVER